MALLSVNRPFKTWFNNLRADLISHTHEGTDTAYAIPVRGTVTPEMYGATGGADDTQAVQDAFDSTYPVIFAQNYNVTQVRIGQVSALDPTSSYVDFNGHSLVGVATAATDSVLRIIGHDLKLYDVQVDCVNRTNYESAIRWYTPTGASTPAQKNQVFGMRTRRALVGLMFGANVGAAEPANVAQSENTVYDFASYDVQIPFVGNQRGGIITLVNPILDCYPYVTTPDAAWWLASLCFNNAGNNVLNIIGGELLKTGTTTGYGFRGGSFSISGGTTIEIACALGYIEGVVSNSYDATCKIVDTAASSGWHSGEATPGFVIDELAIGTLTLDNFSSFHDTNEHSLCTNFVKPNAGSPAMTIHISNCVLTEWLWTTAVPLVTGLTYTIRDVKGVFFSNSNGSAYTRYITGHKSTMQFSTMSDTSVATNSTVYLGFGDSTTEAAVRFMVPFKCVARNLYCEASGAPGATETFTYMLMASGATTSLTAEISGASAVSASDTDRDHSKALAQGETVSIRLITSDGSSAQLHKCMIELEEVP